MARYIEKPKESKEIEAVYWTGENLEEAKEFLRDCFVEVDEQGTLTFKMYGQEYYEGKINNSTWRSNIKRKISPKSGFITKNKIGVYSAVAAILFLENWEEIR